MEGTPDYKKAQAFHGAAGTRAGGKRNLTNLGGEPPGLVCGGGVDGQVLTTPEGANQEQHEKELVVQT